MEASAPIRTGRLRGPALVALAAAGVFLGPWTLYVTSTLPSRHLAQHWSLLWGGFDVALVLGVLATALLLARGSRQMAVAAAMTGAFFLCDAWFDVLTAHGSHELREALAEALLGELPLAAICLWIALRTESLSARRRSKLNSI